MKRNTILLFILFLTIKAQNNSSPCPRLFVYEKKSSLPNRWYGLITLLSDTDLNGVWLRVIFDQPSLQLGNWFGEAVRKGKQNKQYLIKNRDFKLKAYTPHIVRFYIEYNPKLTIPRLTSLRLNGKIICPEEDNDFTTQTPKLLTSGPLTNESGDVDDFFPSDDSFENRSERDTECGVVVTQPRPLITYGEETQEGEFPWHAALYYVKDIDLSYICGASLISKLHMLTVAHCVTRRRSTAPLRPNTLVVYLGKYYLKQFSTIGTQNRHVAEIIPHFKYDPATYGNDIAILKLENAIDVTDYVRPVCLWMDSIDLNSLINKQGSVVGWGYDQTGKVTETLMQTKMPVVSSETCIFSFPEFFSRFTSPYTYCAGFRNGTSVCNGDSGGGMVFPKQTPKGEIWQLRGLVSISVALQNQFKCDTLHYVIFTDSAKYLSWIKDVISK